MKPHMRRKKNLEQNEENPAENEQVEVGDLDLYDDAAEQVRER